MNDKFDYVYDMGHWFRNEPLDDGISIKSILETVLAFIAMGICMVAVIMLFLCM